MREVTMTSLFRPWTEEKAISHPASEMTNLFPVEQAVESAEASKESSSRETRYRHVKEHMRKRSEKYNQMKKGKLNPRPEVNRIETGNLILPPVPPPPPPPPPPTTSTLPLDFPTSCCDGFYSPFDCFLTPTKTVANHGLGVGFLSNPELLETALTSGFPPNLFEDYARFLTEQQKQVAERTRKQRPKKFRCPHCHVGFSNNGQLKGHIRIHTGERPFKCDAESCGKSFTRNEELTRHRRIHSGLRPYPCSECGKRFGRKDHLKKHVKTHFQQRYQLVPILPSHCPYFFGLG